MMYPSPPGQFRPGGGGAPRRERRARRRIGFAASGGLARPPGVLPHELQIAQDGRAARQDQAQQPQQQPANRLAATAFVRQAKDRTRWLSR